MVTKYFGTPFANSGDKTIIPDASQPSGNVSFEDGWTPDYSKDQSSDPDAKDIPRQSENYFKFTVTEALKELQENGFKPYDALVNYLVGGTVSGSDNKLYKCLIVNGPDTTVVDPVGDATGTWVMLGSIALQTFSASGTYTPTDGVVFAVMIAIGPGGGAGGVDGQGTGTAAVSGCGAGGGTGIKFLTVFDASYDIVIGSGGAGGAGLNGGDGSAGGSATTITSTSLSLSAGAGLGGIGMVGTSGTRVAAGGESGGSASGGDIHITGGKGQPCSVVGGAVVTYGINGGTPVSLPSRVRVANGKGNDGYRGSGGIGSRAYATGTNYNGGDGGNGIAFILEVF